MRKLLKNLVLIIVLSYALMLSACEVKTNNKPTKLPEGNITINDTVFKVDIADTDATRRQGLSGHAKLGKHEGMYFVFPFARMQIFWMKEMQFPLDIVWIKNNVVVGVTADIPPPAPSTALQELKHYPSPEPADSVLEINAGSAKSAQIQPGDKVIFIRDRKF